MRDLQLPGRSPVYATEALAATSHPLATSAAIDCLKRGGNAVDAAVTAAFVLAVTEPAMTGIGGDCFAIVATPDGQLHGLNGSGRAAKAASTEWYLERGITGIAPASAHAVTVPGAIAGFDRLLSRFGTRGFAEVVQPAIHYAETGHAVAPRVASDWAGAARLLALDAGAAKHFLVGGTAPAVGDVVRYPALARTLKLIGQKGASGFYQGEVAEDMVATLRAKGSLLTLDDFAAAQADDLEPVSAGYRDWQLAELPPNGQGIIALIITNILKQFDIARLDPNGPERLHLEIEAARLAYACRDVHLADPAAMRVPVGTLVSDAFAAGLAARIDPAQRLADVTPGAVPNSDTVYLTVVDRDRLAVSLIFSIFHTFGSGIATENTGVLLQNRGACFVVERGHPNTIEGAKRPMHTIIPAFGLKDGRPTLAFGVMGGAYQAAGHAHVFSNLVDFGMDVQEAIDAPRLFWAADNATLTAERGLPEATVAGLAARGHSVVEAPGPIGGSQAIQIDWQRGVLIGGSDPRKDGAAMGY
ncbi:MAG: gamma-glutamyltransferase [Ancalomicrobiaceae bacterium]|nr:gamma-glutamyltransferase [Ancalomicrobiaceae bacterium]